MSRFHSLDQVQLSDVTNVTSTENGIGYAGYNDKSLINKKSCEHVTSVTTKKAETGGANGGGVAVATRGIFRARLQKAAHHLPVNMAVLVAEFANDEQDIARGNFSDETLRKAVFTFVVYHMGLQPVPASTPADDGMVQCCQCSYWWKRCRHPDKFRGRWPELHPDRWRRCIEYQQRTEGGAGQIPESLCNTDRDLNKF